MPIIKSAQKAARQTVKRTLHNEQLKKDIKSAIKAFRKRPTIVNLSKAHSELDKAVKKGLLKKNTAARRKSVLAKLLQPTKTSIAKTRTKKPTIKSTTKTAKRTTKKTSPTAKKSTKTTKPTTKPTPKPAATNKPSPKSKATKK